MDLNTLKQERKEAGDKLMVIRSRVKTENRQMTEDENTEFKMISRSLESLDSNIALAEQSLELERSLGGVDPNVKTKMSDLAAVQLFVKRGQASEVIDRNKDIGDGIQTMGVLVSRGYSDAVDGAHLSPDNVAPSINYLEGVPDLWKEVDATIYRDLKGGTQRMPFMSTFAGAIVGEGVDLAVETVNPTSVELTPNRYGTTISVSREALATYSAGAWESIMGNARKVIDRQMTAQIFVQAATTTNTTGATTHTKDNYDELEGSVPVDGIYFMSRKQFYKAKGVQVATGAGEGFLVERNGQDKGLTYEGTQVRHSELFAAPADTVVYGVGNNIAVGFWGQDAYEIIVDPYSLKKSGELEITISKIADVVVVNKDVAFAKTGVIA